MLGVRPINEEDLTARARIRNAALAMLSERGIKGTTIRGVAEAAGVSPALVQHHFGSKEKLREACDEYVMDYIRGATTAAIDDKNLGDPEFLSSTYESAPPIMAYLGSPAAAAMFDEIVDITERYLQQHAEKPLSDYRAHAAVFTAMKLGVTVLQSHVARALGADAFTGDVIHRVGRAGLDIISPELVGHDVVDLARDGINRYAKGESDG
jgi:AcrR family transcriptional regulator